MIVLENVSKVKSGKRILQNVNLRILRGNRYAFVGRNGSGKSSLAKVIGGHWRPTAGKVASNGQYHLNALWRATGFVHQGSFLDGLLSVEENLEVISLMKGLDRDLYRETVRHTIRRTGAWIDLDTRMNRLSGGQRRLVEIVSIVSAANDLLILDEPTRNIDASIKSELLDTLRDRFDQTGCTVVVCTHDRDEFGVTDEYVQLVDGEIADCGETQGLRVQQLVKL